MTRHINGNSENKKNVLFTNIFVYFNCTFVLLLQHILTYETKMLKTAIKKENPVSIRMKEVLTKPTLRKSLHMYQHNFY